jgi:hypothetical protein
MFAPAKTPVVGKDDTTKASRMEIRVHFASAEIFNITNPLLLLPVSHNSNLRMASKGGWNIK